ncbi:hypothetical protein JXJ21_13330 [candidate division KSB1 bacterium]|nr:hypothetical protein [candidate division KSB1 bacterium]
MKFKQVALLLTLLVPNSGIAQSKNHDALTAPGVSFESYLVRWWGAPGSKRMRPIYRISRFDTDALQLHYGIVPGRDLADYTMPYNPIRSFLSFVDPPAELAQQVNILYSDTAGAHSIGFTPRSGVEMVSQNNQLLVKIRNRTIAMPEDVTIKRGVDNEESNPLSLEEVLALRKGSSNVPVLCTVTNSGDKDLSDVAVVLTFEQSFCWSHFGIAENDVYTELNSPKSGSARAFYAWSVGMERGYSFTAAEGMELTYQLFPEMNRWQVKLRCTVGDFPKGASKNFKFELRAHRSIPERVENPVVLNNLSNMSFTRFQPASFKTSPIEPEKRVCIIDQIANLDRPKVRGMNLCTGFPQVFKDIETLREWGCNLFITGLGDPDQTADLIRHGHELGIEMLLAGHGSYMEGLPKFDAFYARPRTPEQLPDAIGQDEDHYYWDAIAPVRSFEAENGKSLGQATHDEMVTYWAKCFSDKWKNIQQSQKQYNADAGIWFYAPFPGVAHVDPLDRYDLFLRTISGDIGDNLTVFPFYYGIEYNQIEYIVSKWKAAGAARVVFLPMREFLTLPSQYIRAITAARRGGADGTCGFNFAVGDAPPEMEWMWKAVILGAWANFPEPEFGAFCILEEPAELVEILSMPDLVLRVVSEAADLNEKEHLARLQETLSHVRNNSKQPTADALTILITKDFAAKKDAGLQILWKSNRGILQMSSRTVRLAGASANALKNAFNLLLRFADLARDENRLSRGENQSEH